MPAAWSSADTALSLLRDAGTARGRAWISAYLLSRRGPSQLRGVLEPVARRTVALRMRGLSQPLHVNADSGGLATYYEIVTQRIYGRVEGFEIAPGATVVDVGANVGVFSMLAADATGPAGTVLSVEPHPLAFAILSRNLSGYGSGAHRQLNLACGQRAGEASLHFVPGRLSVSSISSRPDRTGSVDVQVRALDEIVGDAAVGPIDLLKVDVEGMELAVLRGGPQTLARTARLVVETDEGKLADIIAQAAEHGLVYRGQVGGIWGLPAGRIAFFDRRPDAAASAAQ